MHEGLGTTGQTLVVTMGLLGKLCVTDTFFFFSLQDRPERNAPSHNILSGEAFFKTLHKLSRDRVLPKWGLFIAFWKSARVTPSEDTIVVGGRCRWFCQPMYTCVKSRPNLQVRVGQHSVDVMGHFQAWIP